MYSPNVVEKRLATLKKKGHKYKLRSIDESLSVTEKLTRKLYEDDGKLKAGLKHWKEGLTPDEYAFCQSEALLSKISFRYWAERYGYAEIAAEDGGGHAPARFWPSQERALEQIAKREEQCMAEYEEHGFTQGIRSAWHKTRQQGATAFMRLINGHRMNNYKFTRCIAASMDEEKVLELYKRDKIIIDNLPFFLAPTLKYDTKGQNITLEWYKSSILYQQANQQAGIGTSQQFDVAHMTEVGLWAAAERLQFDFEPTIPKSIMTFVAFESTACGRNNWWHKFSESIRKKEPGFQQWIYVFTPWYINHNKNRSIAPPGWEPEDFTKEHAELIERTSLEYAGQTIRPNKNQLYWWETEYKLAKTMGTLYLFFSNYPATPEQSFQHHRGMAISTEIVDWMRSTSIMGKPYEIGPQ